MAKLQFLTEADVTQQIKDFLMWEGWRAHRLNAGKWVSWAEAMRYTEAVRRHMLGQATIPPAKKPVPREWAEKGSPDWLFVHPKHGALYVEMKAEGKRPNEQQLEYIERLIKDGYAATWSSDFEDFKAWYGKRFTR